jgi:hypothetical protein
MGRTVCTDPQSPYKGALLPSDVFNVRLEHGKSLQVALLTKRSSLKCRTLDVYTIAGASVHVHVIRCTCAGAWLRQ